MFLYIIGHFGSSIFISIHISKKKGISIISKNIEKTKSKSLFPTLHQESRDVVFISTTGILFSREKVVLVFVTSNQLVIYLYLIHFILVKSHISYSSFFEKLLSIKSISSIFLSFIISLKFLKFHRYFIFESLTSSLFEYQTISYIKAFFISFIIFLIFFSFLFVIKSIFLFSIIHFSINIF